MLREEKSLMRSSASAIGRREADKLRRRHAARRRPIRRERAAGAARFRDDIFDQSRDEPAHQFVHRHGRHRAAGWQRGCRSEYRASSGTAARSPSGRVCAQAIVDIVSIVGDVVGQERRLALRRWHRSRAPGPAAADSGGSRRDAALAIAAERLRRRVGERAVVLDQAFQRLPGQVQSVKGGIAALQRVTTRSDWAL